jgi:hypothetical protein
LIKRLIFGSLNKSIKKKLVFLEKSVYCKAVNLFSTAVLKIFIKAFSQKFVNTLILKQFKTPAIDAPMKGLL